MMTPDELQSLLRSWLQQYVNAWGDYQRKSTRYIAPFNYATEEPSVILIELPGGAWWNVDKNKIETNKFLVNSLVSQAKVISVPKAEDVQNV